MLCLKYQKLFKTLIKSRFQGMYRCAHKTATLTSIQHTMPSPSSCPRSCWIKDWIFIVDILWFSRICLAYNFEFQYKPSATGMDFCNSQHISRGVVNGKAGKAAAVPTFSDTLTLSQSGVGGRSDYAQLFALTHLNFFAITPPLSNTQS